MNVIQNKTNIVIAIKTGHDDLIKNELHMQ